MRRRAAQRGSTPPPIVRPPAPAPEPPEPEPWVPVEPAPEPPEPEPWVPVESEPEPWVPAVPEPPAPEPEPIASPPRRTEPRPAPPRRAAPAPRKAPPLRGDRRRGRPDLPPAARNSSRGGRRVLALFAVLIVAVLVFVAVKTFQPLHDDGSGLIRVKVPAGASVGDIGKLLEDRGVIGSSRWFQVNATLTGSRSGLRNGTYTLRRDMRYGTVLNALTDGPKAKVLKTFKLTLPEGLSRKEIAPRIKDDVGGDYLAASISPAALRHARRLGLPRSRKTTEGFLFPATYDLLSGAEAKDLVTKQLDAFAANVKRVSYRTLIIASMVEREAQRDSERPLISAVIHNRLKDGMPLAIDATTRYQFNQWSEPLKQSQLESDSPYNTRINRGLPPTPIGNPGLASIRASEHPARVGYLYYVVKPGTCGRHNFSKTDAQFERDVAAYNAARDKAGGKSPTTC